MSMKILLVNPWIADFAAFDFWMKPYGLLKIQRYLKQTGMETFLLDCQDRYFPGMKLISDRGNGSGKFHKHRIAKPAVYRDIPRHYGLYGITPESAGSFLESVPRPDAILMTSQMTYWYPGIQATIALLKKTFPGTPIGLGGIYATLCTDHACAHSGADAVLINNHDLATFLGRSIDGLHERTLPDYSGYPDIRSYQISITTGCPHHCSFCAVNKLHPAFVSLPIEPVLGLIEEGTRRGVRNFTFIDDALLYHDRIAEFLNALTEFKGIRFHLPNAVNARKVNEEIAVLLKQANFKTVRLGFETTDSEFQKSTGGKIFTAELEQAVKHLRHAGIDGRDLGFYIMLGLPELGDQAVVDAVDWVKAMGLQVHLTLYSPVPGSRDFAALAAVNPALPREPLLHNNTLSAYRHYDLNRRLSTDITGYHRRILN